jgi:DNA-binding CsgD family transcriptional regulator
VLNGQAVLAREQSDFTTARRLFDDSLALRRALGDQVGAAESLTGLGGVAQLQNDLSEARARHEDGLSIMRQLEAERDLEPEERRVLAMVLNNFGIVLRILGDRDRARAVYREALDLRQGLGDSNGMAMALHNLAILAHCEGDYSAARRFAEESLATCRELRNRGTCRFRTASVRRSSVILRWCATSSIRSQIADELVIAKSTVDRHVLHILNKLNANSRARIAAWVATRDGVA